MTHEEREIYKKERRPDFVNDALDIIEQQSNLINNELKGKKVVITSSFNGQVHGSSKKALTGQIFIIRYASVDYTSVWLSFEDVTFLAGCQLGIDCEIIDEI